LAGGLTDYRLVTAVLRYQDSEPGRADRAVLAARQGYGCSRDNEITADLIAGLLREQYPAWPTCR
jgi:hypothetical protein